MNSKSLRRIGPASRTVGHISKSKLPSYDFWCCNLFSSCLIQMSLTSCEMKYCTGYGAGHMMPINASCQILFLTLCHAHLSRPKLGPRHELCIVGAQNLWWTMKWAVLSVYTGKESTKYRGCSSFGTRSDPSLACSTSNMEETSNIKQPFLRWEQRLKGRTGFLVHSKGE